MTEAVRTIPILLEIGGKKVIGEFDGKELWIDDGKHTILTEQEISQLFRLLAPKEIQ